LLYNLVYFSLKKNLYIIIDFYSLTSPSSIYGLSLTNTLGNKNHIGRTLCRTSVYEFNIPDLLEKTEGHRFSIICVTDGIKDVLDSTEIGSFHKDFQNGINEKYEKVKEEVEKERKRKEIYRKYELSYGATNEIRSKSTNNLISVSAVENYLKEMDVSSELVHNMNLLDIKNKLKQVVNGCNKENPLDIYDTNSLNIMLKTFINHNINSYQTSDYYINLISSSNTTSTPNENPTTNTTPEETSTATDQNNNNESSQSNTNSSSSSTSFQSYYPEFLTCLTNFAALCQTLDDCTAINMEVSDIDPNMKFEENIVEESGSTNNNNDTEK